MTVRTAWHDPPPMAAAQQLSHVYPLGSRVNERGRLEIGGCDAIELAARVRHPVLRRRRGRHPRPRARRSSRRSPHARATSRSSSPPRPSPAPPSTGSSARRGSAATSPSAASSPSRSPRGSTPRASTCTATRSRAPSSQFALDAGVGDVIVDNLRDLDLLEELVAAEPRRAPQPVFLRIAPGVSPDTHPAISTGGPEHEVRLRPRARARRDRARAGELRASSCAACTSTSARRSSTSRRSARRSQALAGLGDFPAYNLGGGLGVAYSAHDEPPSIEDYVAAKVDAVAEIIGPGRACDRRAGPRARRQRLRDALRGPDRQAQRRDLRRRRRRDVRQPAPDALRRALRGRGRRPPRAAARAATSSASTASRATSSCATPSSTTRGPATCS